MFAFTLKYKPQIIAAFKLLYLLLVAIIIVGGYAVYTQNSWYTFFYTLGVYSGRTALVFFSLSLLPGISRRFGVVSPLFNTLQLIRRYLGISVFICAVTHFILVRLMDVASGALPFSPRPFEVMGFIALSCLFLVFLTSNDYSVFHLKKWWKRIHSLVYLIVWILFAHIFLQGARDVWMLLIGVTALLEVASHVVLFLRKRKK